MRCRLLTALLLLLCLGASSRDPRRAVIMGVHEAPTPATPVVSVTSNDYTVDGTTHHVFAHTVLHADRSIKLQSLFRYSDRYETVHSFYFGNIEFTNTGDGDITWSSAGTDFTLTWDTGKIGLTLVGLTNPASDCFLQTLYRVQDVATGWESNWTHTEKAMLPATGWWVPGAPTFDHAHTSIECILTVTRYTVSITASEPYRSGYYAYIQFRPQGGGDGDWVSFTRVNCTADEETEIQHNVSRTCAATIAIAGTWEFRANLTWLVSPYTETGWFDLEDATVPQ